MSENGTAGQVAGVNIPTLYDEAKDRASVSLAEAYKDAYTRFLAGTLSELMVGVVKRGMRKDLMRLGHHRKVLDQLCRAIEKNT